MPCSSLMTSQNWNGIAHSGQAAAHRTQAGLVPPPRLRRIRGPCPPPPAATSGGRAVSGGRNLGPRRSPAATPTPLSPTIVPPAKCKGRRDCSIQRPHGRAPRPLPGGHDAPAAAGMLSHKARRPQPASRVPAPATRPGPGVPRGNKAHPKVASAPPKMEPAKPFSVAARRSPPHAGKKPRRLATLHQRGRRPHRGTPRAPPSPSRHLRTEMPPPARAGRQWRREPGPRRPPRTLAPIWFPHWPAWICTISRMAAAKTSPTRPLCLLPSQRPTTAATNGGVPLAGLFSSSSPAPAVQAVRGGAGLQRSGLAIVSGRAPAPGGRGKEEPFSL